MLIIGKVQRKLSEQMNEIKDIDKQLFLVQEMIIENN